MDPELEALIKFYDAFIQARGPDAKQLLEIYESRLTDVLERRPNLSRAKLQQAVRFAHLRWTFAQQKPPTLPPKA